MMRTSLTIIFICITFSIFPQLKKIRWGKPGKNEIKLTTCSFDSLANSVILAERGEIDFVNGYAHIQVYRKIKILKENGLDKANVQIPFYHKNALEKIIKVKAQTINMNNGEILTSEINNNELYTKIHNNRWSDVRFTFPAVQVGSILEYKYTLITKRITFLDAWAFQHPEPTLFSEIKVNIPNTLTYSTFLFGDKLNAKYNNKENRLAHWSLNEIKGYDGESNVFCYTDNIEKLQFQLLRYEAWEGGGYSKGVYEEDVLKDWDQLSEEIFEEFKNYLNRKGKAKSIIETLKFSGNSNTDKIKAIYNYMKTSFQWNGDLFFMPDNSLNELITSRSGNSAELNLLYCLLLCEAGIDAYPVLISTKSHGKMVKAFPMFEQFNHIIIAIKEGEGYIFTDIANKSNNCLLVPYRHMNYHGFLLNKDKGKWIDVKNETDTKENNSIWCTFENKKVQLNIENRYSGYFALEQRLRLKDKKSYQPALSNLISHASFNQDSMKIENEEDEYKDYENSFFYSSDFSQRDKIMVNLNYEDLQNPYKQDERLFPIEFGFPYKKQKMFVFELPNGYVAKVVPENQILSLPQNIGRFIYNTSLSQNKLTIFIKNELNLTYLPKEYYGYLKEYYNKIILKLNEPIIFEKQ